uniref:Putative secreted protein n=1 Tax=Anopheles triannulatus TaxID=58253 RepID=A0A2M4B3F7_9DIPT
MRRWMVLTYLALQEALGSVQDHPHRQPDQPVQSQTGTETAQPEERYWPPLVVLVLPSSSSPRSVSYRMIRTR